MTASKELEDKHERIRERRIQQVTEWADYVRTHPDEEWGRQVNKLVNAQIEAARHQQDERPDRQDVDRQGRERAERRDEDGP